MVDPPLKRRRGFRRLSGLDRSGGPPASTRAGQPWNVWTLPNVIGMVRFALIPIFLITGLSSQDGTDALPAILFAVCAWGDYADGIAARLTGQYSRFGALLDPVVDRLLVASGVIVVWRFDLLPHWAIILLLAREVFLLGSGRIALEKGIEVIINWPGRLAVIPVMSALFFAMAGLPGVAHPFLYIGLVLAYVALALYVRDARRQVAAHKRPSS